MRYTLTLDGVPVGFVELEGVPRAVGHLFTLPGFHAGGLRRAAQCLGLALRLVAWRRAPISAAARALASTLAQAAAFEPRLGLVDERGASAAIWRITVVEFPRDRTPLVVAALRDQAVPRGALVLPRIAGPGQGARPAA